MKKFFFVFLMASPFLVNAQNKKATNDWNIDVGPTVAVPIRYLHMFSTFGLGVDGAATHPLDNGIAVGGRVNYAYFFGSKPEDPSFANGKSHYAATSLLYILADAHYLFSNKIIIGLNGGLGLGFFTGNTTTSFARLGYAGYEWEQGAHTLIFSLYFNQTTYEKNVGLRANIRL